MKNRKGTIFAIVTLVVFLGYFLIPYLGGDKNTKQLQRKNHEPAFQKEAQGAWISTKGDTISFVDVELAKTPYEIETGLMYRSFMKKNQAMLFMFPDVKPRSFWMKNTKISLDIVYLDDKFTMVSAAEYTKPFSEKSLPSTYAAQYVLELNAGYLKSKNIKKGDRFVLID